MLECVVQHRDNDWYRKKREEEEAAINEARTNGAPKQAMFVADVRLAQNKTPRICFKIKISLSSVY